VVGAAAEAAKAVEKEDRSTISLKVNIGTFDQPRSSLALTYARSEDQGAFIRNIAPPHTHTTAHAQQHTLPHAHSLVWWTVWNAATALRAATKADAEAMTMTVKLAVKEGADLFEVGEVSSGVKGVLALAKKSLKYSNVATKMDKAGDGRDVLALSFAFQPSEIDIITSGAQVLDTLKITNLEVKLDSSERPGDAPNPNGASSRFSATAGLDRASIQALYDAFGASELPKNLRQGFALASALRNVSLLIESDTINHFLSKEFNKVYPAEDVNGFAALKSKIIMPNLAKIFGNDELPAVFVYASTFAFCFRSLSLFAVPPSQSSSLMVVFVLCFRSFLCGTGTVISTRASSRCSAMCRAFRWPSDRTCSTSRWSASTSSRTIFPPGACSFFAFVLFCV
jgi:hypothetical protein